MGGLPIQHRKLKTSFQLIDTNGDGALSKEEVRVMLVLAVKAVSLHFYGKSKLYNIDDEEWLSAEMAMNIENKVNKIFDLLSKDNETLTESEFIDGFYVYPDLCGFFSLFPTPPYFIKFQASSKSRGNLKLFS